MNWYMQSGTDSDVVVSTRIRFARNLNGFKFNLQNKEEVESMQNKIKDNLYAIGYNLRFFKLKDMDDITKMSLVEKNLISPEFALNKNETGAILINDEENCRFRSFVKQYRAILFEICLSSLCGYRLFGK